jgi:hypothetical protein
VSPSPLSRVSADPAPSEKHPPSGETAAHCRKVVIGVLPPEWEEWFAGLKVLPGVPCPGETTLTGPIADQTALHGIITRVRDPGLPLVSMVVSYEVAPAAGRERRRNEKDHPSCDGCGGPPPSGPSASGLKGTTSQPHARHWDMTASTCRLGGSPVPVVGPNGLLVGTVVGW